MTINPHDSTSGVNAAGTTVTVTLPIRSAGDMCIVAIAHRDGDTVQTKPAEFTAAPSATGQSGTGGGDIEVTLYYRLLDGTESATYNWTLNASVINGWMAFTYTPSAGTLDIDIGGGQGNASSVNCVAPSVNTSTANTMLVFCGAFATNTPSASDPTGMTGREFARTSGITVKGADESVAASGATGTRTSVGGNAALNVGVLATIKEIVAATDKPRGIQVPLSAPASPAWRY